MFQLHYVATMESRQLIATCLGRRRELGNSLGTFRYGVFGQFTRKHEADGRLNLATAQRSLLVVRRELSSLRGNAFKDIVNKRVHDRHALLGNTRVGVNLLQDLVNVRRVRFRTLLVLRRLASGRLLWSLCGGLLGWCLGHGCERKEIKWNEWTCSMETKSKL